MKFLHSEKMSDQKYSLKTVDRAFAVLRVVMDAPMPLTLSEVAARADLNTSNAFRFLKTLEGSGHVTRDDKKRYAAIKGGSDEIGLSRGIDILDHIAASPNGAMRATDLAALIAVSAPQAERALAKLAARSVVEHDPASDAWRLSTGMMRFFKPLLNDQFLARFIRPAMAELAETFGETVSWFVPHGWEQVVVEVLPSPQPIRYVMETGARQPVYLGAAGKAHLAALDSDIAETFLDSLQPVQLTRFQLDKAALIEELAQIRARGYAMSDGERVEGAVSVAVAVRGVDGQVMGVISVMMPKFRTTAQVLRSIGETLSDRAVTLIDQSDTAPLQRETAQ
jgi:IclR family acetate operon transcriptional repressor